MIIISAELHLVHVKFFIHEFIFKISSAELVKYFWTF